MSQKNLAADGTRTHDCQEVPLYELYTSCAWWLEQTDLYPHIRGYMYITFSYSYTNACYDGENASVWCSIGESTMMQWWNWDDKIVRWWKLNEISRFRHHIIAFSPSNHRVFHFGFTLGPLCFHHVSTIVPLRIHHCAIVCHRIMAFSLSRHRLSVIVPSRLNHALI